YRTMVVTCTLVGFMGAALFALSTMAGRGNPVGLYMAIIFWALAMPYVWKLVRGSRAATGPLTKTVARMAEAGEIRFTHGELRVTLLPEGVLMSDQHAATLVNWLFGIQRIEQSAANLPLFTTPSTAVVVPRRAFGADAEADAFAARARELFAA